MESRRQDLSLRPLVPNRHWRNPAVFSADTAAQALEKTGKQHAPSLDTVAPRASIETRFGASVVRELPPDPGPHERLLTVRQVASRLGVSTALATSTSRGTCCAALRVGGALRFQLQAINEYLSGIGG
jgi:hypothetical protein